MSLSHHSKLWLYTRFKISYNLVQHLSFSISFLHIFISYLTWGRPFSETLFFKGAQETCKQGHVCYVNQKHRDKPILFTISVLGSFTCITWSSFDMQQMGFNIVYRAYFTLKCSAPFSSVAVPCLKKKDNEKISVLEVGGKQNRYLHPAVHWWVKNHPRLKPSLHYVRFPVCNCVHCTYP